MSQTYAARSRTNRRNTGAASDVTPVSEQIPNSALEAMLQETDAGGIELSEETEGSLSAVQNVDPHAGRRLSLDEAMAGRMQQQFGIRMDQVELRESSQVDAMDARAFAKGNVVQFAPGQFQPDTEQGRQLIQHELAHVAQQARGGILADVPGFNVNADEGLERQADMGDLTASTGAPASLSGLSAETAPVQGLFDGLKKKFAAIKRQFRFGQALKKKDQHIRQIMAERQAETDEITKVMKEQGYSDDEIQAQLMFQQVNKGMERRERFDAPLEGIRDAGAALESPEEMDTPPSAGAGAYRPIATYWLSLLRSRTAGRALGTPQRRQVRRKRWPLPTGAAMRKRRQKIESWGRCCSNSIEKRRRRYRRPRITQTTSPQRAGDGDLRRLSQIWTKLMCETSILTERKK